MKKIKILEVTDAFYPNLDGVVKVVDNYAKQLNVIADCVVTAPAPAKKNHYKESGEYSVVRCTSISSFEGYRFALPFFLKKYRKKLKDEQFDIIHVHSPFTMGRIALSIAKKQRIPLVITLHTKYKQDFERTLGKRSPFVPFMMRYIMKPFKKADQVWTVSEEAKQTLKNYGYKGNVEVIKNATDLVYPENPQEYIDIIDQKHNLKGQQNVFLFVGRMALYKGLDLLCNSLAQLKKKNKDFKMIFVGNGFDVEKIKKLANDLSISDNCIFAGRIDDKKLLSAYYLRSDVLIFPSTFDTSGVVKVEAAAFKKGAVLIENSCCAEDVKDGFNGFLCKDTVESLSNKLLEICDNCSLMKIVGENAFSTLYRSWEDTAKEVLERYLEVIQRYKKNND